MRRASSDFSAMLAVASAIRRRAPAGDVQERVRVGLCEQDLAWAGAIPFASREQVLLFRKCMERRGYFAVCAAGAALMRGCDLLFLPSHPA